MASKAAVALTWPVGHVATMLLSPSQAKKESEPPAVEEFKGKAVASSLLDHISVQTGTLPKLLFAWIAYSILGYPTIDFGAPLTWPLARWITHIFVRDLIITFATAGLWDFLLYGPFQPASMANKKFNPKVGEGASDCTCS